MAFSVGGTVVIDSSRNLVNPGPSSLLNLGGAPLNSPTFTGTPAGPTASVGTDTTQLATTAFVNASAIAIAIAFG